MAAHPVIDQLVRPKDWWRDWIPLWVACLVGIAGVAGAVYRPAWLQRLLSVDLQIGAETGLVLLVLWGVTLSVSLVTAVTAASLTSRSIESGLHETLCATPLARGSLARAYARAALHRMRVALALALGVGVGASMVIVCTPGVWGSGSFRVRWSNVIDILHSIHRSLATRGETHTVIAIAAWSANLFAAPIGVALALRWRRTVAVVLAPLIMAAATLLLAFVAAAALRTSGGAPWHLWGSGANLLLLLVPIWLGAAWPLSARKGFTLVIILLVVGWSAFAVLRPVVLSLQDGYWWGWRAWKRPYSHLLLILYNLGMGLLLFRQRASRAGAVACVAMGIVTVVLPLAGTAAAVASLWTRFPDVFLPPRIGASGIPFVDHLDPVATALMSYGGLGAALAPLVLLAPYALAWGATRLAGRRMRNRGLPER